MLKKLLFAFLTPVILGLSIFAPVVHAESTWYSQPFPDFYNKVYDENVPVSEVFGERYTAAQVEWIIYSLFAFGINKATGDPKLTSCYLNSDLTDCVAHFTSLLTSIKPNVQYANKNIFQAVFQPREFSGIGYIRNSLEKFNIVPEAQAQGVGFVAAFQPIQGLWKASRDFSYFLFILVAIVFAFMIMFRVKINPQTVISVQSALPKLVMAIILVTFSYAIAGFVIDLMYVIMGLFSLFASAAFVGGGGAVGNLQTLAIFQFLNGETIFGSIGPNVGIFSYLLFYLTWFSFSLLLSLIALSPITGLILAPIYGLLIIIGFLVFVIVYIIQAFRIFWMLLKTIASIYLLTIFAPMQIALGVLIPRAGFNAWIRSMFANVMVFPLVGILFFLAFIFLFQSNLAIIDVFLPDFIGDDLLNIFNDMLAAAGFNLTVPTSDWSPPLFAAGTSVLPLIFAGISFVIISAIPRTAELIKAIIAGKEFGFGTAIGEVVWLPSTAAKMGTAAGIGRAGQWLTTPPPPGTTPGFLQGRMSGGWQSQFINNTVEGIQRRLSK